MQENLKVAMFGHKRLSREGGIEIVVKELCTRMIKKGYLVTCYNRSGHHVSGAQYDNIDTLEDIRIKGNYYDYYTNTVSYVFLWWRNRHGEFF